MTFHRYWACAALAAGIFVSALAFAADTKFIADLDPAPITLATRADLAGEGSVSADLNGNLLTISGTFDGLPSPATDAHLQSGPATGVPGDAFASLTISQAISGSISGTVTLSRAQVEALRKGAVYIQINTVKATPPYGNLRGWFLTPEQ